MEWGLPRASGGGYCLLDFPSDPDCSPLGPVCTHLPTDGPPGNGKGGHQPFGFPWAMWSCYQVMRE